MSKWTDEELAELEDPDMWDWDNPEWHEPVPNHGVQVRVRFVGDEIDRIERAAERAGMKLTEYIRAAALAQAQAAAPAAPVPPPRT